MIVTWILQGLLGAAFLFHGMTKLMGVPFQKRIFASFGYSPRFRILVGAAEAVGAVLVLIPATAAIGVAWLAAILVGVIYTHVAVEKAPGHAVGAALHLALAVAVAVLRWPDLPSVA